MKRKVKLILDFEEAYRDRPPGDDCVVLSSTYENVHALDVRKFRSNLQSDVADYGRAWSDLTKKIDPIFIDCLKANEANFFRAVISPLARWIEAIDHCFVMFEIEEILFTSFSTNNKIFYFEAEGEINRGLFYKKNYYSPYYLKEYVFVKYGRKVRIERTVNLLGIFLSYYTRNILLLGFILIKQLFFKFFVRRRNYLADLKPNVKILCSTRAIVQTEFVRNYQRNNNAEVVLIANEQSFRLLKHYNYLRKNAIECLYAEGDIDFLDLLRSLFSYFRKVARGYKFRKASFFVCGLKFSFGSFCLECITRELDYLFYSISFNNQANKLNSQGCKVISFEMFTPYALYLKRVSSRYTYQIQSTLIEPQYSPDFVISDFFFFTNPISHQEFIAFNGHLLHKIGCLPYFKYLGVKRLKKQTCSLKTVVYFTQPIDLQEEEEIIHFLVRYCDSNALHLIIKPHPRQLNQYESTCAVVADKFCSIEELIGSSDLIITRSSSVGLDAWVYGVPCIFVKLNRHLQNQRIFYAPHDYKGCVHSFDKLKSRLDNFDELIREFRQHRLFFETDLELSNVAASLY